MAHGAREHPIRAGQKGGGFSSGFDDEQDLRKIPDNYSGCIWTDRIDIIAPYFLEKLGWPEKRNHDKNNKPIEQRRRLSCKSLCGWINGEGGIEE
ncbi:MAG: hypothetical protein JXQ30_01135 [Spirochaetes bacterium]|nr:hypothetical protein [Spirochaetota bacterium]